MFYQEIRIKECHSYIISLCPFRSLYKNKFILMVTSLGTNAVVVTRVHCIRTDRPEQTDESRLEALQSSFLFFPETRH